MIQGGLLELEADDELVEAVRRGDDEAFGELVARHRDWLTARCRRHLGGDAHAAEDVVQECLVALQRTLRTKDAPMRVRPWLSVVARNRCIDETRKLRAVPTSAIPETAVFDPEVGTEDEFLVRAWNALTGRHRTVLELRELGGLSYEEIAANLAVTSGAVEALLFRARTALRREYARAGGKVASMAPIQEAVARATGGKGVLTAAVEHGSDLVTAIPGIGDAVAATPAPGSSSGAVARLVQELQLRLLTTPGLDGVLVGPAGGSGRLRGALAAVGLLLGGVATAATTIVDEVDLPAPPPVVVHVPDASVPTAPPVPTAPTAATPPAPSTPAAPAPAPAPAPAVPEAPSPSSDEVPPTTAPTVPVPALDGVVPTAVDGSLGTVDEVVAEALGDVGELLGGLLSSGR